MIIVADTCKRKRGRKTYVSCTMADWSVQETRMKMSIGNLGSCRCTKQTRQHLHFCIVTCFARGTAPCVCALVHQYGQNSIGFDPLRPGLVVIRINPDRSADTAIVMTDTNC